MSCREFTFCPLYQCGLMSSARGCLVSGGCAAPVCVAPCRLPHGAVRSLQGYWVWQMLSDLGQLRGCCNGCDEVSSVLIC